jgi:hypothetical protein
MADSQDMAEWTKGYLDLDQRSAAALLRSPSLKLYAAQIAPLVKQYQPEGGLPLDMYSLNRDLGPETQNPRLKSLVENRNNLTKEETKQLDVHLNAVINSRQMVEWKNEPWTGPHSSSLFATATEFVKSSTKKLSWAKDFRSRFSDPRAVRTGPLGISLKFAFDELSGDREEEMTRDISLSDRQKDNMALLASGVALDMGLPDAVTREDDKEIEKIFTAAFASVGEDLKNRYTLIRTTDVVDGDSSFFMPKVNWSPGVDMPLVEKNLHRSMVNHYEKTGFFTRLITGVSIAGKQVRPDELFSTGQNQVVIPVHSIRDDASTYTEIVGFHVIDKTNGEVEYISGEVAFMFEDDEVRNNRIGYFNALNSVYNRSNSSRNVFMPPKVYYYNEGKSPRNAADLVKNRVQGGAKKHIIDTAMAAVRNEFGGRLPVRITVSKDGKSYEVFRDKDAQDSYFRYLNQAAEILGYPEGWKVNSSEE